MDSIKRDIGTRRFWKLLAINAFAAFGALAVVGGVMVLFAPDIFVGMAPLGWVAAVAAAGYGVFRAWPRPVAVRYQAPATTIRLVCGDIFEQHESHLVIGVSDTFDTASPHISSESVQGQFLSRVYDHDLNRLDADIDEQLRSVDATGRILGKAGKSVQYPLGTTLTLRANARRYFLVAYTTMDTKSMASSTTDGVWNSLSALWRVIRAESNGKRVCIPMIGGGQSKLSPVLPAMDSVRFIALSFMLASRTSKVCDELVIVAPPALYDGLDHLEIQAFLKSLRPS
ncbi:macro domain-containing protein [Humidisolicoccus flavus]|uniref:macro domain-containing protein n=1 Tax=Humidisolicoccus flavus TaxID=3111414 RepID=UPI00324C377D